MAEFAFVDLLPEILSAAPGVNDPAVMRSARLAARYFCKTTDFLRIENEPLIDIVTGVATYAIPADTQDPVRPTLRALEVWLGDQQVEHRSSDQLDRESFAPRENQPWSVGHSGLTYSSVNTPWRLAVEYPSRYYFQDTPSSIRLVGIPDQDVAEALRIVSSVQPGITADSIDISIVDNWYEILVKGTKAYVLQMPQKSWTNQALGMKLQREFEADVGAVLDQVTAGFAANSQAVGHVRAYP